ncbi:unnamed protein product [Rotaria magnacalcarata]|uniref:Uncharacterized protein n=1 Tax=Rotaria magnacalcarata TaxID=392030 RepID=A0A816T5M6_9BILA|nr:unnamed protein product [Rotaria magnacalcarata]CAF1507905.1 unnamed protein product [Rotaria magnacalcarata]CAF2095321.1 unnamed protein product [Rotaria magnacalcarata]CAF2141492.1 unnamed protein product [Rotaria magnacalcarata]CAF3831813.1 unnamed protein product [Rotaria magnacalcarata]
MKFTVAITCLLLVYSCLYRHFADGNSEYEQVAQRYLTKPGLKIPANGEAIDAATKAKETEAVINLLEEKQNLHFFNLEVGTNKNTAMLEATTTSLSWWRGGGSCAVKLEARALRLAH